MNFKSLGFLLLALSCGGCQTPAPEARVYRVETLDQTIGGLAATGGVGDYVLENDKIRVLIHGRPGGGGTGTSTGFGGSILDADLQRFQPEFRGGNGLDQLFELGPLVNLKIPVPACHTDADCPGDSVCSGLTCSNPKERGLPAKEKSNETGAPLVEPSFEILERDETNGAVKLVVRGAAGDIADVLSLLGAFVGLFAELAYLETPGMIFETTYELRPGESFIRIESVTFPFGRKAEPEILDMNGFTGSTGILAMLLGDLEPACDLTDAESCAEGETCTSIVGTYPVCIGKDSRTSGSFGGWLLLMGQKLSAFAPGLGFDPWANLKIAVAKDIDFFANPVPFQTLTGIGDRVSYAFYSGEGELMIPLATSAFTVALSNAYNCPTSESGCLVGNGVRMTGYLAIGEGDVASAIAPLYALRGIEVGRIEGVVVDATSGSPVSGVDVLFFRDPWAADLSDEEAAEKTYDELVEASREQSTTPTMPAGEVGAITHMKTDVGSDPIPDGNFSGSIPVKGSEERLFAVARKGLRYSAPVAMRVKKGATSQVSITLPTSGILHAHAVNSSDLPMPAKITVGRCMPECGTDGDCAGKGKVCDTDRRACVPEGGCTADSECDPDEHCDTTEGVCTCGEGNFLPREVGGHWEVDGVITTGFTDGDSPYELSLPVGVYEVILSRGIEFELHREFVTVDGARHNQVIGRLDRVVDTSGYIAADFHVHGANSPDSGIPFPERVLSFMGEGIEFLSSSDHDVLTNYWPTIRAHKWDRWITAQVGIETSPLMLSHFLGFPMKYQENQPQHMPERIAFDWAECVPLTVSPGDTVEWKLSGDTAHTVTATDGAFDFAFDPEEDVRTFTHTFSSEGTYRFYSETSPTGMQGVIVVTELASPGEEAEEEEEETDPDAEPDPVFTIEVGDFYFSPGLTCRTRLADQIIDDLRAGGALVTDGEPDALVVLPHVFDYFNYYGLDPFQLNVDAGTFALVPIFEAQNFSGRFDGLEVANGKSQDLIRLPTVSEVREYNADLAILNVDLLDGSLSYDAFIVALRRLGRTSIASILERTPEEQDAFIESEEGVDCSCLHTDECPSGDAAEDSDPCAGSSSYTGIAEHSFRMLNRGIYRPMLANSDTHDLYDEEAGMPRNYVRSSVDKVIGLDADEINRSVRKGELIATYGPFTEIFINGEPIGSRVQLEKAGSAQMQIRVQSPLWFDVDRVEVYQNGRIIRVIEDCTRAEDDDDCIALPNDSVMNVDLKFDVDVDGDAWFVVAAMGIHGKDLSPIYSTRALPRFGFNESLNGFLGSLPLVSILASATALVPSAHPILPYALTNPIWVSVGDACFSPVGNGGVPSWINCLEEVERGLLCPEACTPTEELAE